MNIEKAVNTRFEDFLFDWDYKIYLCAGEYMIWTDGTVKKCLRNTNFSPDEYPDAWEDA